MSTLYKLGDGPINYDWNKRFCSIEATELIYSQSLNDNDKKTINIQGAAVSNICKIKGKNFSFCISIPPPLNKIIYLAADSFQECAKFREKCLKATQNLLYEENLNDSNENEIDEENRIEKNVMGKSPNFREEKKKDGNGGFDNPFKNKLIPDVCIFDNVGNYKEP
jgi:hypothetical protein